MLGDPGFSKKAFHVLAGRALRQEIEKINKQYFNERQTIYEKYQRQAWADWRRRKAMQGDRDALAALRSREAAQGLKGNTVAVRGGQRVHAGVNARQDNITKQGTVIYRVGASAVRDDGDKLKVSRGATQDGLTVALRMAMERYGNHIAVNGTAEFKEQVVRAAAAANLPITFDAAVLERRRQSLLHEITTKENHDDPVARNHRGRTDRGRAGGAGPAAANTTGCGRRDHGARRAGAGKPDIGRIGRKPPPQSQHRLRNLSQLGVVRIASGSEVLLPRHVSGHLEFDGAKPDSRLRRDVSRSAVTPPTVTATDKYIAEREQTRLKVPGIAKHRECSERDAGPAAFAGIRHVEGESLALLKRGEEIIVLPIDAATERRMKRLAIGDPVTVTATGAIRTKGRSR